MLGKKKRCSQIPCHLHPSATHEASLCSNTFFDSCIKPAFVKTPSICVWAAPFSSSSSASPAKTLRTFGSLVPRLPRPWGLSHILYTIIYVSEDLSRGFGNLMMKIIKFPWQGNRVSLGRNDQSTPEATILHSILCHITSKLDKGNTLLERKCFNTPLYIDTYASMIPYTAGASWLWPMCKAKAVDLLKKCVWHGIHPQYLWHMISHTVCIYTYMLIHYLLRHPKILCHPKMWVKQPGFFINHTVNGRNPAPVDMVNIRLFTWLYTSQVVVWDFFHQQFQPPHFCGDHREILWHLGPQPAESSRKDWRPKRIINPLVGRFLQPNLRVPILMETSKMMTCKKKHLPQMLESQYPILPEKKIMLHFFRNFGMEFRDLKKTCWINQQLPWISMVTVSFRAPNSRSEANDHGITHRQCQPMSSHGDRAVNLFGNCA